MVQVDLSIQVLRYERSPIFYKKREVRTYEHSSDIDKEKLPMVAKEGNYISFGTWATEVTGCTYDANTKLYRVWLETQVRYGTSAFVYTCKNFEDAGWILKRREEPGYLQRPAPQVDARWTGGCTANTGYA